MTKRQIKSIYHWSLMGLVMGLPLLLTGLSYIPNSYNQNDIIEYESSQHSVVEKQYETNEVTTESDLIEGHIYKYTWAGDNMCYASAIYFQENYITGNLSFDMDNIYLGTDQLILSNYHNTNTYFWFVYTYNENQDYTDIENISASNILPIHYEVSNTTTQYVVNNGAYQVHQFNEWFISQPLNNWYKEIMDLTFGLPTSYSPMNNILYFPLYAVWVLVFDLLYDVVALVPCVFHNVLDKLKGEKE